MSRLLCCNSCKSDKQDGVTNEKLLSSSNAGTGDYPESLEEQKMRDAARNGDVKTLEQLITDGAAGDVNKPDDAKLTPLHYAAMNNRVEAVRYLLDIGGDVSSRDVLGRNVLDVAIDSGSYEVCREILRHRGSQTDPRGRRIETWLVALMNDARGENGAVENENNLARIANKLQVGQSEILALKTSNQRITPVRRMVAKMPRLARDVLDKCLDESDEAGSSYAVFLDDSNVDWNKEREAYKKGKSFNISNSRVKSNSTTCSVKTDHPVNLMIEHRRKELLAHSFVKSFIDNKCAMAQMLYLFFVTLFLTFVGLTTCFVLYSTPPYAVNWTACEEAIAAKNNRSFEINNETDEIIEEFSDEDSSRRRVFTFFIWLTAICGMVIELVQFYSVRWGYLCQPINYLDWFCYLSACLITIDYTGGCEQFTSKQWVLAAFCLLACFVNVIILLRRFPIVGFYVVLVGQVFKTFTYFLSVLSLFLSAFAVSFYVLLHHLYLFSTVQKAVLKTVLWLTNDQNFDDSYIYSNPAYNSDEDFYLGLKLPTLIVYLLFLAVVGIVVFNVLIALAVGDVTYLLDNARFEKFRLVFDLALDVEASLPRCLRFEASESHQTDAESQQAGAVKVRQPKTWLQRIRTQLWKLLSRAYVSVETRSGGDASITELLVGKLDEKTAFDMARLRADVSSHAAELTRKAKAELLGQFEMMLASVKEDFIVEQNTKTNLLNQHMTQIENSNAFKAVETNRQLTDIIQILAALKKEMERLKTDNAEIKAGIEKLKPTEEEEETTEEVVGESE